MKKIPFQVSARTARLIGRENVANADGAIIELVKNCYDADAPNCIVYFDNKYVEIPEKLNNEEYRSFSEETNSSDLISTSYIKKDGFDDFILDEGIDKDLHTALYDFFSSKCCLYIIDNGCGMDDSIIMNYWMTIGTDVKEKSYESKAGRVRTGAKGIGRFALDRLGKKCEMYTKPEGKAKGYLWTVNWGDFEKAGAVISDVKATLDEVENLDLKATILNLAESFQPLAKLLEEINLYNGTILKISQLRDAWEADNVRHIFENLEILVPPKEQPMFRIDLFSSLQENECGQVISHFCDDFDYRVTARYPGTADKKIVIEIERNELDISLVEEDYMNVFKMELMKNPPYDYKTFKKGKFTIEKSLYQLVKGYRAVDAGRLMDKIGEFSFTFYFVKNMIQGKEKGIYPYKNFSSASRKAWLDKFGGVKIFRDDFRIRPYGEKGNDWLNLGERQAESPGGAGHTLGGYRIRPNQIFGSVYISRITNRSFQDKSGREGIQENDAFNLFLRILIGLIGEFERDRNTVMYSFKQLYKIKNKNEEEKRKAKEIADRELEEEAKEAEYGKKTKAKVDDYSTFSTPTPDEIITLSKGYKIQEKEIEERENESRLLRSLASIGLIVTSFTHELKNLRAHLMPRTEHLKEMLKDLIDQRSLKELPEEDNPFIMIKDMREQDIRLKHWLDYSLSALKRDKRRRVNVDLSGYFYEFKGTWKKAMEYRKANLKLVDKADDHCTIRAFKIDLDSIFNNILANSLDAFKRRDKPNKRDITITWENLSEYVSIIFEDTGPGLSEDFKNPNDIFLPFETSKRDKRGERVGTGMGMYLVKTILDDYDAEIRVLEHKEGFKIKILFPLQKEKDK